VDLSNEINKFLRARDQHETDTWRNGKLHPSSDLQGCTRRTVLELAGAERSTTQSYLTLRQVIGTGLHRWLQTNLEKKHNAETEVDVTEGLPDGWTGSADIVLAKSGGGHALYDFKVISGAAAFFRSGQLKKVHASNKSRGLPTDEQIWQVSAYAYALRKMGYEITDAQIVYLPIDKFGYGKQVEFEPWQDEIDLIEDAELEARFSEIEEAVELYRTTKQLPPHLAPEQQLIGKPTNTPKKYEVHQRFDWRCSEYCAFYGRSCFPDWVEGLIGVWVYDRDNNGWRYEAEEKGIEPLVRPVGNIVENS
jgi:hypothetical protein